MKKIFLFSLFAGLLLNLSFPLYAGAYGATDQTLNLQQTGTQDGGQGSGNPADSEAQNSANQFRIVPCDGVQKYVLDANGKPTTVLDANSKPCDFNQLVIAFNRILRYMLYLAIPLVTGMILYTGWLYLTANGDTGQLEKAKKMFIPVILGMFWIGASYIVIFELIKYFVNPSLTASTNSAIKILDPNQ